MISITTHLLYTIYYIPIINKSIENILFIRNNKHLLFLIITYFFLIIPYYYLLFFDK